MVFTSTMPMVSCNPGVLTNLCRIVYTWLSSYVMALDNTYVDLFMYLCTGFGNSPSSLLHDTRPRFYEDTFMGALINEVIHDDFFSDALD